MFSFRSVAVALCCFANFLQAENQSTPVSIEVPDGFEVQLVAAPPLVGHPMMACFDERGRLFIAEALGTNGTIDILEKITPNFIRMLEDTDGDGVFDKSTIFADKLQIPNGALWLDGSLYVAEPPGIWKFTDTDGDGVADKREHVAGKVRSNGMSSTLHGPVRGPTGRLFWCSGQGGYSLDKNVEPPPGRIAPGVFTLRTDGTEHEVFSVGGQANPVEVCFSPEGEIFGTVAILDHDEGARHDALMHWVYGGVSHISPNDPCPLKRTGDFLPPLSHVGQVAPAGTMRYRGEQFGPAYRDNIFWAQFNTHKVIRTQLTRDGATFKSKDEEFVVSPSVDFHATDVFEDADGSLLVIDTGGWFRHGCPTSQIAKPDVLGGIYRIRRKGAKKIEDARGLKIDWAKASADQLCQLLDDPRPAVEDRAIETLSKKSGKAFSALKKVLRTSKSVQARRDAIWTLARIEDAELMHAPKRVSSTAKSARSLLRAALDDKDWSVRQSAVYAIGMNRGDEKALPQLMKLVVADSQTSIRREAATALGRIGSGKSVSQLLNALRNPCDQFLQHSLVYALIQINQPSLTAKGLAADSPRIRLGALLALNQMDKVQLTREQISPQLHSDNLELQRAAFRIAIKNTNTITDTADVLRQWLREGKPSEERAAFLSENILAYAGNEMIQQTVADALASKETSIAMRLLLIEAIKRPTLKEYPAVWHQALEREVRSGDLKTRLAAVGVVQERGIKRFDELLKKIARDENEPVALRIAVIGTLASRLREIDAPIFEFVRADFQKQTAPLPRMTAARTLGSLHLSDGQLVRLAEVVEKTDAMALPILIRAYAHSSNEAPGLALASALEKSSATQGLSPDELARLFKNFPASVNAAAKPLLTKLGADLEKQQQHLQELLPLTENGDMRRGKEIFFGKKVACFSCHRISGQGGVVGPNLSEIGKVRAGRDLLESVLYPSASIVQGYRPYNVETDDGEMYSGLISRQTPEAVWLRGADLAEKKLETKHVKSMRESALSIMPQGLGDALTKTELSDLLAYLQSLK